MNMVVDRADGSQSAGTQTGYGFYRKQHVIGGWLFVGDAENASDFLQYWDGFSDVTGSTVADLNDIFSLWLQGEILIKGGDTIDVGLADAQLLSHID